MARILIVDDEEKLCRALANGLCDEGHSVDCATSGAEALEKVGPGRYDVVITDLRMPDMDGLEVLREVKKTSPETEVVLMTAHATVNTAVSAVKEGAFDYLLKPFSLDDLSLMVRNILERKARGNAREENTEDTESSRLENIIGKSPAMIEVFKLAAQVAQKDVTVLIQGESGTGKELVAGAIHGASPRAEKPFIMVNCTALPETLFENELFGHEKGAFTGADSAEPGKFEKADGGTLFLDEIGDLSPATQGKLLRALEQKSFHRVGGTNLIQTDVRIIAATNVNLENAVREKKFREDLYYRLRVFPIQLPLLRNRAEDIPLLAGHFLARSSTVSMDISPEAMDILRSYPWPGNVRELENIMISTAMRCSGGTVRPEDLPPEVREGEQDGPASGSEKRSRNLSLEEMEKSMIEQALEKSGGNKTGAARMLGITRRALYSRMERLGIRPPEPHA
ncbi:sigma-54-dependent transcriptional regulator [Planctomycetota bacterium]